MATTIEERKVRSQSPTVEVISRKEKEMGIDSGAPDVMEFWKGVNLTAIQKEMHDCKVEVARRN